MSTPWRWIVGTVVVAALAIAATAQTEPQRQPVPGVPVVVRQGGADAIPEFSIRTRQLEMELEEARDEIRSLSEQLEAVSPEGRRLRAERLLERAEADRARANEQLREQRDALRETQARLREAERERDRALREAQAAQDLLEREPRESARRSRRRDANESADSEDLAALRAMIEELRARLAAQVQLTAQYRDFAQAAAAEAPPVAPASQDDEAVEEGLQAFQEGDLRRARRLLERALRQHEEDAALHGYLAAVYFAQGQHARAQGSLERAVALNPVDPTAHFNLAVLLASMDPPDLQKARLHYQESLRLGGSEDEALAARLDAQ